MDMPGIGVAAIVVEDGRVLVGRRAKPPAAGLWSFPGGRLELGESLADGLRREVREECGIEIEIGPLVDVVEIIRDEDGVRYHYVVLDYAATRTSGRPQPADDIDDLMWAEPSDLQDLDTTPRTEELAAAALGLAGGAR